MNKPLMSKATALWLLEETSLTFEQISRFCGIHILEVQAIADNDIVMHIPAKNPIFTHELTQEEITRCEKDSSASLTLVQPCVYKFKGKKSRKYTHLIKRQNKPRAIAWLIKNHPEISDSQIVQLIGTTKKTIDSIRQRTHWNIMNIRPADPVLLGLCRQGDFNDVLTKAQNKNKKNDNEEENNNTVENLDSNIN